MKLARTLLCILILTGCDLQAIAQTNWPQFRGADSRGVATSKNLLDRWSATENVAWKRDMPGRGWSSPIVWGDRVFLTTVINTGKSEEPKKGLYFGGDRPKPADSAHQWKVFCLDVKTGEVRWERQVHEGKPETPIHLKSSYASETPITDGERVYCCFGNVGVFCFDLEGKEVWKHTLKPQAIRNGWGTAASPVLHRDRLYLVNDNDQESYLLALDAKTGEQVWRTPRDEKSNWATPFVWQNAQRTEIVTPGTGKVRSYDLDGKLLWSLKGMSSITIATPYEHNGLLYVSSGYVLDLTKSIYAIRPGASGDISLKAGETSNEFIAWSQPKAAPYNPSTLIFNERLYVLYDMGMVRCLQANDGTEIFSQQRLPNGRAFTSSPWAYNGKVFCLSEDGVTFVLKEGNQFELSHTNELAADDMCMATPAIAGDRLLIRTSARIYCIQSSTAAAKIDRPEKLTATIGDVLMRIDGPKMWTLSGFDFQNSKIAVEDSAYGSVLNISGVGILGSAHFLDVPGKLGEVEKEQVSLVQFFLDEQPVTEISPTMNLVGQSFRMTRESTIRGVQLNSSMTLRDGVLTETVRLRSAEAVDLKVSYPLMYAWSPAMSRYLFGDDNEVQRRGVFLSEPAKPAEGLEKTSRWMAVYNPQDQKGAVVSLTQRPATSDAWLQFTDAPGIYRKLRLMSFSEKTMPAGFDGTFQMSVAFFTATDNDWEAQAQKRMQRLQPPTGTQSNITRSH